MPSHSRSLIPWLLLAVAVLIVYGSLYPFNFKPDATEGGVLAALSQLSWQRAGRGDRIANVLLYLPLGFCLFLWLETRLRPRAALIASIAAGTLLSLCIEVAQVFVSIRVPSLTDLTLNSFGTALGVISGMAWGTLSALMHLPARAEKPMRDPGAALLIGLWLAWRLFPLVPQLDLSKLKAALRPLFDPEIDPVAVFVYLTCWLVVNQLVAAVFSRPRRLEVLLLVIACVLVGTLLIAGQTFVPAELVALLLLLPLVVLMHRMAARPRRAALVLAVATVLIIDGLAPFDFTAARTPFDFWPFMKWLAMGVPTAVQMLDWSELAGKLFLFGALMWALKEWGASIRFALVFVTSMVLAIELLQMWLPHQSAAITDPVLALGVGLTLRWLYQNARVRAFAREPILPRGRNQ